MPIIQTTCQHPNKHVMELLFVIAVFIANSSLAIMAEEGFSLELVHIDSVHSPLYPGNLTDAQRIKRLVHFSNSRINWLKSLIVGNHEMALRPTIVHDQKIFMVKLLIGTPQKEVFLHFDTASDLVWTQCEPCQQCFPQSTPKFVPKDSRTFTYLPCKHPLCAPYRCADGLCRYRLTYDDEKYTNGILAKERFVFESSSSGHYTESIGDLVFGCSTYNSIDMYSKNPRIGGIMGMSAGPLSFVQQLYKYTQRRFSYCLVPDSNGRSYLRFGTDIPKGRNAQTIPLVWVDPSEQEHYFVDLKDISINGQRLNLPPGTFAINHNKKGGCIFDSGSPLTYLIKPVFEVVSKVLVEYFKKHKVKSFHLDQNLCFEKRAGFAAYPSIAFHFRGGATFQLPTRNSFGFAASTLCLLMMPDDSMTLLGSIMHENFRLIYDISNRQITFSREICNQK